MTKTMHIALIVLRTIAGFLALYAKSTRDPRDDQMAEYLVLTLATVTAMLRETDAETDEPKFPRKDGGTPGGGVDDVDGDGGDDPIFETPDASAWDEVPF